MSFTKMTTDVKNITPLPNKVNNQADALKQKFDKAGVDIKNALNGLIDELGSPTAAENIGVKYDGTNTTLDNAINELKTGVDSKQNTLTFDDVPTSGSQNPVKSDGIFGELETKSNVDHKHVTSDVTDLTVTASEINQLSGVSGNIQSQLNNKVDKVEGKDLSTNDYDETEKQNVAENTSARHTHANKNILDGITSTKVNEWDNKQNIIPDLETIRVGASKGNTALQSEVDPTVPDHVKAITSENIATWNGKQDALVSGTNIKTINNQSILGNGNITIQGGGTGDVSVDNETIVKDSDNTISTVAIKDNNNQAIKTWNGTQTEFDAISEKDENTIYYVDDDVNQTQRYELIERIVFNGTTGALFRSETPQGKPYDFDAIVITGKSAGDEDNIVSTAVIHANGDRLWASNRVLIGNSDGNGPKKAFIFDFDANKKYSTCISRTYRDTVYQASSMCFHIVPDVDEIHSLEFQPNGVTPGNGATLEIWAKWRR